MILGSVSNRVILIGMVLISSAACSKQFSAESLNSLSLSGGGTVGGNGAGLGNEILVTADGSLSVSRKRIEMPASQAFSEIRITNNTTTDLQVGKVCFTGNLNVSDSRDPNSLLPTNNECGLMWTSPEGQDVTIGSFPAGATQIIYFYNFNKGTFPGSCTFEILPDNNMPCSFEDPTEVPSKPTLTVEVIGTHP